MAIIPKTSCPTFQEWICQRQSDISLLWPHPQARDIADEYRHADGSGNDPRLPQLGQAGTSYSRRVQSTTAIPVIEQPDPGLVFVFDSLLHREAFVEHTAGNAAMMFG